MKREATWSLALILAGLALFVWHSTSLGVCIQDDAFISLRYAQNLASGEGLVYNPGEHVEGFTNFAWTVLSALPFLLGVDPLAFLRWAGILSGLLALLAAAATARELSPEAPLAPGLAVVMGASLSTLATESAMGLETMLFAALATGGIALYLRERRRGAFSPFPSLLLAGAALTRPEGVLLAGMAAMAEFHRGCLDKALLLRTAVFVAPVSALFAFRIAYYHDLVPNTFHAKVGGGLSMLARGAAYSLHWSLIVLPLLLLAAWGAYRGFRAGDRGDGRWLLLAVPLVFTAYVSYVGGDYKPTYRFFALPTLFALGLAASGLCALARSWRRLHALQLVALALVCSAGLWWLGSPARDFAEWRRQQLPIHLSAGRWLRDNLPQGSWLAAGNAGVLPYESGLPTIDMFGLCDRTIGTRELPLGGGLPGHEKGDGAYVLDRKPALILFQFARFSAAPLSREEIGHLGMSLSEREIWADPRFATSYRLRSERMPGFTFNFFERKRDPR